MGFTENVHKNYEKCLNENRKIPEDKFFGKVGIRGIESNLGTAIRTGVVLIMAWIMVYVTGKQHDVRNIPPKELSFIILSGFAAGGSWLCYYRALQDGAASAIVPIDKLSILVTVLFSGSGYPQSHAWGLWQFWRVH